MTTWACSSAGQRFSLRSCTPSVTSSHATVLEKARTFTTTRKTFSVCWCAQGLRWLVDTVSISHLFHTFESKLLHAGAQKVCALRQTPHPKANSSPVGGCLTCRGHSSPSSCAKHGPAYTTKCQHTTPDMRLMLIPGNAVAHLWHSR